jgi:predicted MPP superfamily phosphohydrolase
MPNRLTFYLTICSIGLLCSLPQWYIYRRGFSFLQAKWTIGLFLMLPAMFFLPHFVSPAVPHFLTRPFAFIGGYWLVFFYYSVIFMALYFLSFLGTLISGQQAFWSRYSPFLARAGFFIIILAIALGGWRALHPVYRNLTLTTSKPLPRAYKIALVTDIHLGTVLGRDYATELVQKVNAVQPDLILLGGDLIDDSLDYVKREGSYLPLADLKSSYGVYAIFGNHDYISGQTQEEARLFGQIGIRFLKNEVINTMPGLELTGLDDWSHNRGTENIIPTNKANQNLVRILADHQPWKIEPAAEAGYDLYLAGHTHAGQFFPNRLITQRLYLLDYGAKQFQKMLAVVSDGYGFWGAPVRIGPAPEIVVITLKNN